MKNLLIAVLLACCQAVSAQSIDQIIDLKIKSAEARQKAYADSLFKVKTDGGGTQNPPNDLKPCDRGPVPGSVVDVTTTSAVVIWDGENVFGWDYSIYKGTERVAFNSVKPTGNREPITYAGLSPGEYTFTMQGNTCKSEPKSIKFTVPKPTGDNGGNTGDPNAPPTDPSRRFEFLMGTTGGGFDASQPSGINSGWVERIEAFKYSWGYGISGISLWIHWDGYEKKKGVYESAALQRVISFCRERKLGLGVVFLAKRLKNDGFLRKDQMVTFSNGTILEEGVKGEPNVGVYPGYGCDECNEAMAGAIKDIAKQLKTYDRSLYMALGGGHTGELVNHIDRQKDFTYAGDFSSSSLSEFNEWVKKRGIANPGRPTMVQGAGIDWPHPDFNNPLGLEFSRFQTYNIYKHYKSFTDAVKSIYNLPCIYLYAAASNRQLQSTANANLAFIAGSGDGAYGSDGDGLYDHIAKFRVNSVNQGTFPNGYSIIEFDPDDMSRYRYEVEWTTPPYCQANPDYNIWEQSMDKLMAMGVWAPHTAMASCVDEIKRMEPSLKRLWGKWIGKPYVRPNLRTVEVNVTDKYRRGDDLLEGINVYDTFTKYTDGGLYFWGGVSPFVDGTQSPPIDNSKLTGFLDSNLGAYGGNLIVEARKPAGTVYSYSKGNIGRDDAKPVASISKGVAAATFLAETYDNGTIQLEDKVSKYIPSWRRSDKQDITIRQVVSHTSGIHDETTYDGARTLGEAVDGMANTSLDFTPGTQFRYSTTSYQILARIAEIVSGKHWEQIFNERIRYKCNMQTAEFNPLGPGPVHGNPKNPLAGYGLSASLNDLSNFAAMLRDNGMFNGQRVLSEKAISLIKANMTAGLGDWGFGFILDGDWIISESAKGLSLNVRPGLSYVLMTQSTYEETIGVNNGLRSLFATVL